MGRIEAFCRKWGIREFSLFGSVLTDEFRPDSDVDVLAVYDEDSRTDLFGHMHAEQELAEMFGRKVDLVMKDAVKNPFRRRHILDRREIVYAR
jgi:hypothetical protein